jgi:hypothetical protein
MCDTDFAATAISSLGSVGPFGVFLPTPTVASKPSHLSTLLFLLCTLVWVIYGWRKWTCEVVKSQYDNTPKRSRHSLWRFSNLLMLIAVASYLYSGRRGVEIVPLGDALLFTLSWIIIGVAFLFRYWEDQSLGE